MPLHPHIQQILDNHFPEHHWDQNETMPELRDRLGREFRVIRDMEEGNPHDLDEQIYEDY